MRAMPRSVVSRATKTPRKQPKREPRQPGWLKEGKRLAALLKSRKIGRTDFAIWCGVGYHNVYRWCAGFEFTPDNQAIACAALGLEPDALTHAHPERHPLDTASPRPTTRPVRVSVQRRDTEARAVLELFKQRPIAAHLTPEHWNLIRSIRFIDAAIRPSVALYEAVALALLGAIPLDEIVDVAELNAELDRTLALKPPLRRR
jgi:hypothetical protein